MLDGVDADLRYTAKYRYPDNAIYRCMNKILWCEIRLRY